MRVLFVDHVESIVGGAEINLIELLATSLIRRRWETGVACPRSGPVARHLARDGHAHFEYRLPEALRNTRVAAGAGADASGSGWITAFRGLCAGRKAAFRLMRIAEIWSADVVVSCTNKDHLAASLCRRPTVWWINDAMTADFFSWPVRRLFTAAARAGADHLVAVSDFAGRALVRQGVPGHQVHTIHNGVDLDQYRRGVRGAFRKRLGIPGNAPLAGWIGRVTPWKGPDFFVELAREWISRGRAGHFVLVGGAFNADGEFARDLRSRIEETPLRGRVHGVGFQAGVSEVLTDMDLLVHCSLRPEPFGRVLVEAMALGVPVVAARAGGVPEIVESGVNGLLAEPGDHRDYLEKIERILLDPPFAARLAASACESVRVRFQLGRVAGDFDRLFNTMSGSRRPRSSRPGSGPEDGIAVGTIPLPIH